MKYLAYYDKDDAEGRGAPLAAKNKIDYISNKIAEKDGRVDIISASMTSSKGYFKKREEKLFENVYLRCFKAYKWGNKFQKILSYIHSSLTLFFFLLFNVKRNEKIVVYHSLGYMRCLNFLKAIKKFKLILEVEEIYGDVGENIKTSKKELKFFKKADAFIFPTILLNEKININNKPYVIIHGTYNVEKQLSDKFDDGKIHCVYAGTFDPRKGGVLAAVATAEYLSNKYHMHIIGFGSEKDKKLLVQTIDEVSQKTECKITYDGLKSGEEYIKFIQSCHIGLSTQNPNAIFNDTSFPSKVLSYLANGLRVVSVKIKALETSGVNDLLCYYDEQKPEKIAKAIKAVDIAVPYDSRERIKELDRKFTEKIKNLSEKV